MSLPAVRINDLRVPGLSREHARQFGKQVANQLAARMPASVRSLDIGTLYLRLSIPSATPLHRIPSTIAENISRTIR
jgi:hypothetical protein